MSAVVAEPATVQAPAPVMRRVLAQAGFETRVLLRNGEQIMVTIILPIIVLIGLGSMSVVELDTGSAARIDVVTPQILAFCIMASAFTSQAILTAFDRRNGVLRLLATTPLGRSGLLAGKALAVVTIGVVQLLIVGGTGLALGWRPHASGIPETVVAWLLGSLAFTAFAVFLAGALRAEAVIAVANLLLLFLAGMGGLFIPASQLPGPLAAIAGWLPSGALGDCLQAALLHGTWAPGALAILAGWAVIFSIGAVRTFQWH